MRSRFDLENDSKQGTIRPKDTGLARNPYAENFKYGHHVPIDRAGDPAALVHSSPPSKSMSESHVYHESRRARESSRTVKFDDRAKGSVARNSSSGAYLNINRGNYDGVCEHLWPAAEE